MTRDPALDAALLAECLEAKERGWRDPFCPEGIWPEPSFWSQHDLLTIILLMAGVFLFWGIILAGSYSRPPTGVYFRRWTPDRQQPYQNWEMDQARMREES